MSEVDKLLSLPSLYSYRLALGYFRVVKGGVEIFSKFPSECGGHGLSLCFFGFSSRSRLELFIETCPVLDGYEVVTTYIVERKVRVIENIMD